MNEDGVGVTKLRLRVLDMNCPQYMVAKAAGMNPTRLSEYCTGQREIPSHHLVNLCYVLKCEPKDIIGEAEVDELACIPLSR